MLPDGLTCQRCFANFCSLRRYVKSGTQICIHCYHYDFHRFITPKRVSTEYYLFYFSVLDFVFQIQINPNDWRIWIWFETQNYLFSYQEFRPLCHGLSLITIQPINYTAFIARSSNEYVLDICSFSLLLKLSTDWEDVLYFFNFHQLLYIFLSIGIIQRWPRWEGP